MNKKRLVGVLLALAVTMGLALAAQAAGLGVTVIGRDGGYSAFRLPGGTVIPEDMGNGVYSYTLLLEKASSSPLTVTLSLSPDSTTCYYQGEQSDCSISLPSQSDWMTDTLEIHYQPSSRPSRFCLDVTNLWMQDDGSSRLETKTMCWYDRYVVFLPKVFNSYQRSR